MVWVHASHCPKKFSHGHFMVQLRRVVVLQGYLLVQAWEFGMLIRGPLYQILKAKKHLIKMVGWDQVASDFRLCKWPPPLNSLVDEDLARYFDELNSKEFPSVFSAEQDKCQVITFSHFLPRYVVLGGVYTHGHLGQSNWVGTLMYACLLFPCFQESKMSVVQQLSFLISTKDLLASSWSFSVSCIKIDPFFLSYVCRFELCPEKRMLFYPNLPKVVGSDWLEARVRSIHGPHGSETACHVFGHTHFCWDATLDGIRWAMDPASQTICFVQKVLVKFLMGFPWWAVLFRSSFCIL